MSDLDPLPPFPELIDEPVERWQWPAPPFAWHHQPAPDLEVAQPCRIETPTGSLVDGDMLALDLRAGHLRFRTGAPGAALNLPLSRVRRLTLTTPLRAEPLRAGGALDRVPVAAHEREYRLTPAGGGQPLTGRTAGHIDTAEGLFLFTPVGDETALLRVFVPKAAYSACDFGPTAQDLAADHWLATPQDLLAALARQQRMPVLPIGQSLLNLGLVTPDQLERALAQKQRDEPLGESLVHSGVISQADLRTAIAHKMGYPLVDLTRYPVDPAAAHKLPLRLAVKYRSLPIMVDQQRLIVAMDRPQRALELQALFALKPFAVVPVLASKSQILLALSGLPHHDGWSDNVSVRAGFFATTQ